MKPKLMRAALGVAVLMALNGCANLTTVGRSTQLPAGGTAVHLDAAQRVVIADMDGNVCAEPSPDALQAYAASLGASASAPSQGAVSLAQAFSASAGSFGLRTQSITLMRDHLYRICELKRNKMIGDRQVTQLLQRSQDLTLGILAIEQLTGAVVANQVKLSSVSGANTDAKIDDFKAKVDQAEKNEAVKKAAVATATDTQKKAQTARDITAKNLEVAKAEAKPDEAKIKALNEQLTTQEAQLSKANADLETANVNLKQATAETNLAKAYLGIATTNAGAIAAGLADSTTNPTNKPMDKESVEKIATATENIVRAVLSKGHLTDMCINSVSDLKNTESAPGSKNFLGEQCAKIFDANIEVYKKNVGKLEPKPGEASNPELPPEQTSLMLEQVLKSYADEKAKLQKSMPKKSPKKSPPKKE